MRFITADKIFDGHSFLPEDSVLVLGERNAFSEIVSLKDIDNLKVERLEGIITPGFVNAHCHLELSHLKNKIPRHTGLPEFGKQVISLRNKFTVEEIAEAQHAADKEMWSKGIVAVGDISNGTDSFEQKSKSNIFYHTFLELIGLNPANSEPIFEHGKNLFQKLNDYQLKGSLAAHAPYSTSKELIKKIADFDAKNELSLSIHNQESEEETKFFNGEKSGFDELYKFLNLDVSWFQAPKTSSLKNYVEVLSDKSSILVHNTTTKIEDIETTRTKNISWCFCPCANLFIENKLPDLKLFKGLEHKICIGTDSLAGNIQLDVLEEINRILNVTDLFTPENLLQAITFNGAAALGVTRAFGKFIKGRNAGLNRVNFKNNQFKFVKKIV